MIVTRKLNEVWYTQQDVRNDVSPGSYVAWVLWLAEASYTGTQQVLLVVYEDLKVKIRRDIKMPTPKTFKKEFI